MTPTSGVTACQNCGRPVRDGHALCWPCESGDLCAECNASCSLTDGCERVPTCDQCVREGFDKLRELVQALIDKLPRCESFSGCDKPATVDDLGNTVCDGHDKSGGKDLHYGAELRAVQAELEKQW